MTVNLTWLMPAGIYDSFEIFVGKSHQNLTLRKTVANVSSDQVADLEPNTRYTFGLRTKSGSDQTVTESRFSEEVSNTTRKLRTFQLYKLTLAYAKPMLEHLSVCWSIQVCAGASKLLVKYSSI